MQYEFQISNLPGQFVHEFAATQEEEIVKYHAEFAAQFHIENSTMPQNGIDFRIVPALPQISTSVYMRALRDLLNMDYATGDADVPGRIAALYVALAKIFDLAATFETNDKAMNNALAEITGIAAAAFGQVQHGSPYGNSWQRKNALEIMLAGSMARELQLEQKLRERAA